MSEVKEMKVVPKRVSVRPSKRHIAVFALPAVVTVCTFAAYLWTGVPYLWLLSLLGAIVCAIALWRLRFGSKRRARRGKGGNSHESNVDAQ